MAASSSAERFPVIGRLIARARSVASRTAELSGLRGMDRQQADQIAHELGLSRTELFTLCANSTSGDLLKQRLAEFGLAGEALAKKHPEVLQDLQRVCGTCTATSRCAHDFAAHDGSRRDEYCPNTCTLYALRQEGIARRAGLSGKS